MIPVNTLAGIILFFREKVEQGFAAMNHAVCYHKEKEVEGSIDEEDDREGHFHCIQP